MFLELYKERTKKYWHEYIMVRNRIYMNPNRITRLVNSGELSFEIASGWDNL